MFLNLHTLAVLYRDVLTVPYSNVLYQINYNMFYSNFRHIAKATLLQLNLQQFLSLSKVKIIFDYLCSNHRACYSLYSFVESLDADFT